MRLIDHQRFAVKRKRRQRVRKVAYMVLLLIIVVGVLGLNYLRPLPIIQPTKTQELKLLDTPVVFGWPKQGQAAVGAKGFKVLAESGNQKPLPTASVAKVITALMIVKKHPLQPNEQGPIITISESDVDTYNRYVSVGGSVVAVNFGEEISEYQALETLLLPSANNMADTLAVWAYGSAENYITETNKYVASLGLTNTHISDASGFAVQTVSTAHDLVILGEKLLEDPVLSQIVDLEKADVPVAGAIQNTNSLINNPNIIGIKTGLTDEAGGCYLLAANHEVAPGKNVTIVVAVMAAPSLAAAMDSSQALLGQSLAGFKQATVIAAGQKIGEYKTPWGGVADAVAQKDLKAVVWTPNMPKFTTSLYDIDPWEYSGGVIGNVDIKASYVSGNVPVVLNHAIGLPTTRWRVLRTL